MGLVRPGVVGALPAGALLLLGGEGRAMQPPSASSEAAIEAWRCNPATPTSPARRLPAAFDPEGARHEAAIQAAFAAASTALLTLLHSELGLPGTLAALRQYLLLAQGDLLGAFLDSAEEELAKPAPQVSVIRLQSLLDLGAS